MFSGQFIKKKMPTFILEVLKKLQENNIVFNFLLIGSGPLETKIINDLNELKIDYYYPGFVNQEDLPKYYASSKILLFPSLSDPWGVVANEACAVGTPVITCENTGVSNDLIIHNYNGLILPLNADIWAVNISQILNNGKEYVNYSDNCMLKIKEYSLENSSISFLKALKHVSRS